MDPSQNTTTKNGNVSLLEALPLHTVASILSLLNTTPDILSAILSCRIFYESFRQHQKSIISDLIKNIIPPSLLSYALYLLNSSKIEPQDADGVTAFLEQYRKGMSSTEATRGLSNLCDSDVSIIIKNWTAAQALCKLYTTETLRELEERTGIKHSGTLSTNEEKRIYRAIFRYQILWNLCYNQTPHVAAFEKPIDAFFATHSPWVNKQLSHFFYFMETKTYEAFMEMATYDINWAGCFDWIPGPAGVNDFPDLKRGTDLPFLVKLCEAQSYNEWKTFIQPDSSPAATTMKWGRSLTFMSSAAPLSYYACGQPSTDDQTTAKTEEALLEDFSGVEFPRDDFDDRVGSRAFDIWHRARLHAKPGSGIITHVYDFQYQGFGYVMWDYEGLETGVVHEKIITAKPPLVPHFTGSEFQRRLQLVHDTLQERRDILRLGGCGYWKDRDFSRVDGLSEEDISFLKRVWEDRERQRVDQNSGDIGQS